MTREEAIRCLSVHSSTNGSGLCTDEQHYEAKQMAIKVLEQTTWIPCSERLPEKNMDCLVAVGEINLTQTAMYSDLMGTIDHRIFYQGDYGHENFVNITQYVNAWMPLPEPYKGE